MGEGLRFLGQFITLPPAAWIALLGLAALIAPGLPQVLFQSVFWASEGPIEPTLLLLWVRNLREVDCREGDEEMKRAQFHGSHVRGLAAAVLIFLAVALILALAILPPETLPAAPTEQAPAATPTSLPSSTLAPKVTLTPTITPLPPSTVTPTLSATAMPSATTVPAATAMPSAAAMSTATAMSTAAFSPTTTSTLCPATAVPSPSIAPELSLTATSTLETEGMLRRVVLTGELEALKPDGQITWPAVQLQCWNASGQGVGRVGLTQLDGMYRLPDETARVQLWIGSELGGADWWQNWDSLPADATSPEIILVIASLKREVSPPTAVPPPVPRPTSTPCPP